MSRRNSNTVITKTPFCIQKHRGITRCTDFRDTKPRSRPVFPFHRPETFRERLKKSKSLGGSLLDLPALLVERLRDCQIKAINNLEISFKGNRPKALIQMATPVVQAEACRTSRRKLRKARRSPGVLGTVSVGWPDGARNRPCLLPL